MRGERARGERARARARAVSGPLLPRAPAAPPHPRPTPTSPPPLSSPLGAMAGAWAAAAAAKARNRAQKSFIVGCRGEADFGELCVKPRPPHRSLPALTLPLFPSPPHPPPPHPPTMDPPNPTEIDFILIDPEPPGAVRCCVVGSRGGGGFLRATKKRRACFSFPRGESEGFPSRPPAARAALSTPSDTHRSEARRVWCPHIVWVAAVALNVARPSRPLRAERD